MIEKERYLEENGFHKNFHGDYINLTLDTHLLHRIVERSTLEELKEIVTKKIGEK